MNVAIVLENGDKYYYHNVTSIVYDEVEEAIMFYIKHICRDVKYTKYIKEVRIY